MKIAIPSFDNGSHIPEKYAFGIKGDNEPVQLGENYNPHVIWSDVPKETKSLVLLCVDPDVPSVGDDVNKPDRTVSKDLARINFYHWLVINIEPSLKEIHEGEDSVGITAKGKKPGERPYGITGINSYTQWFANNSDMAGNYGGYDGPCPPWNDEIIHRYYFKLYALDVPKLTLHGNFTGAQVESEITGHVLAKTEWLGLYTLNPELDAK